MPQSLPQRPSLEWLRKAAKQRLKVLRAENETARLSDAQFALARDYGFESWRKLKQHVDRSTPVAATGAGDFLQLVGTRRLDEVRAMLAAEPGIVNEIGPHPFWGGRPQALHVAIETKQWDMIEVLLNAGADVNGSNDAYDLWSPLMLAIKGDSAKVVTELLGRGARVGLAEGLLMADDSAVERQLDAITELPVAPNGGSFLNFARTPLAIDRLIEKGASMERQDHWGTAPIEALSGLGEAGAPLVQHLVARGLTAAPEQYARIGDRKSLDALFAANPARVLADLVVMAAVSSGHHALVEWLLERGASVDARAGAPTRHTALHAAAWNGDLRMVRLLVKAGADSTLLDEEHRTTALHWAEVSAGVSNNPACTAVAEYLKSRG